MASRSDAGPASLVPTTSSLDESIGVDPSIVLHFPFKSKFSSENPIGSMILWHAAQTGLERCSSIICRSDAALLLALSSSSGGTFGGGTGGGVPKTFSRIHLPRATGDVRSATEVTSRKLPRPRRNRRLSPVIRT